jgi:hypothetical protein
MKTCFLRARRTTLASFALLAAGVLLTGRAAASQGGFTISAANAVIAQGGLANSAITVTPLNGYTGDITFAVTGAAPALTNGCVLFSNYANVSGVNPTTVGTITIATQDLACPANVIGNKIGGGTIGSVLPGTPPGQRPERSRPMEAALGGILLTGLFGVRSRKMRRLMCLLALVALGGFSIGCSEPAPQLTPKGSYVLTLVGTDSSPTPNLTASTTFTVTIQ